MDKHSMPLSDAEKSLRDAAFEYHRAPTFGKISVTPTKALSNQRDLSLAYSPGVAYPCLAIEEDPNKAAEYTSRGNLVGVVTNGTAVRYGWSPPAVLTGELNGLTPPRNVITVPGEPTGIVHGSPIHS